MQLQLSFDFVPSDALSAAKAERVRAAVRKYRDRSRRLSDEDITGRETDVLGLQRGRSPIAKPQGVGEPAKRPARSAELAPARFHLPRPPQGRPITADGRQSFHFELTNVTKGVGGVCRTNDGRNADPAGHVEYVGRDEAVAIEADGSAHDAITHVGYVGRNTAVATDDGGEPVILTNIPGDPAAFFAAVVDHERTGKADGICLAAPLDPEALKALTGEKTIPPALKAAIEQILTAPDAHRAAPSGSPKVKSHPFQVDADTSGCAAWLKDKEAGALVHLRDGRGGIAQRRVIAELPAEITPTACRRVLSKLAAEFEQRRLRYYVALHAPSAANNHSNWHFHLLYYDRPCAQIDGQWDFAIVEERTSTSRNKKRRYPHRQAKDKEVSSREWPGYLRKRFADAVNVELAATSSRRRYDPRTYAAMGIEAEQQQHLGTRAAFLAACGAAPAKEQENARKGWAWRLRQLLLRHDQIEKDDADRISALRVAAFSNKKAQEDVSALDRQLAESRAGARAGEVLLRILHPMARSNAEATTKEMKGHAADLAIKLRASGKNPEQHQRYAALTRRGDDADTYLQHVERDFAAETKLAVALIAGAETTRRAVDFEFRILQESLRHTPALPSPVSVADPKPTHGARSEHVPPMPLPRPAQPKAAPSPPAPIAGNPAHAEVENWLVRIEVNRRRLTRRDGRVEPLRINDLDRRMLTLASPEQLKELDRIRDRQNRLIARIVDAVVASPGILTIPAEPHGKWALAHRHSDMHDAMCRYIDDPSVEDRLRAAHAKGNARLAAERDVLGRNVHRVVDDIAKLGAPVLRNGKVLTISKADASRLGVAPDELQSPSVQQRLAGIHRSQERIRTPAAASTTEARAHPTSIPSAPMGALPTERGSIDTPAATEKRVEQREATTASRRAEIPAPRPAASSPDLAPSHPLVTSWHEALLSVERPGSPITVVERNRRAAVAINDPGAAEELRRMGSDLLAAARAHAAENSRYLQRAGRQLGHHLRVG